MSDVEVEALFTSLITDLTPIMTREKRRISELDVLESFRMLNAEFREAMIRKRMRQLANNEVVEGPPIFKLPTKLMVNILSRLHVRTILACVSVCNSWERIIFTDPDFAKFQFVRSATKQVMVRPDGPGTLTTKTFLVDLLDKYTKVYVELTLPHNEEATWSGVDIIGSCNGLVCLCTFLDRSPIAVWNPLTREYINIPRSGPFKVRRNNINPIDCECSMCLEYDKIDSEEPLVASGFGYSRRDQQYKVVRVLGRRRSSSSTSIGHGFGGVMDSFTRFGEVFTLGEPTWRKAKGFAPQITHSMSYGTYLKGKFYWVCSNFRDEFEFLESFNFEDEEFGLIPPPPSFKGAKISTGYVRVQELGGHISLCDFSAESHFDIWMMKEAVGGRVHWVRAIAVQMWHHGAVQPIKILNKEEILLLQDSRSFVSYNCTSKRLIGRLVLDSTGVRYGAIAFVPSFFSLKNIVREGGEIKVLRITQSVKTKP